jgi:plasmid maintenance system antidote protein VapI
MATTRTCLEEQLKTAIVASGLSVYRLAKDSGVSQPALCRFVNGQRGITLATASKLVEALGLELRPIKTERKAIKKR